MRTDAEQLMSRCWVRGLDYSHVVTFGKDLELLPTEKEYHDYCDAESKEMDKFMDTFTDEEVTNIGKAIFQ